MPFGRHHPEWGTFAVTIVLLGLVAVQMAKGDTMSLNGAVIGFVAGYWLPTQPASRATERSEGGSE